MTDQVVYNHNIIMVGDPHDPLERIIINYWIQENKQLESVELIGIMVTPIQNPQLN